MRHLFIFSTITSPVVLCFTCVVEEREGEGEKRERGREGGEREREREREMNSRQDNTSKSSLTTLPNKRTQRSPYVRSTLHTRLTDRSSTHHFIHHKPPQVSVQLRVCVFNYGTTNCWTGSTGFKRLLSNYIDFSIVITDVVYYLWLNIATQSYYTPFKMPAHC